MNQLHWYSNVGYAMRLGKDGIILRLVLGSRTIMKMQTSAPESIAGRPFVIVLHVRLGLDASGRGDCVGLACFCREFDASVGCGQLLNLAVGLYIHGRFTAEELSKYSPPSLNESGVTLSTPIIKGPELRSNLKPGDSIT